MEGSAGLERGNKILRMYFPDIPNLQDVQEPALDAVLREFNTLCLMATGMGKSLIYQVAGLANNDVTLVMSPLIALMGQQVRDLEKRNVHAVSLSEFSTSGAYDALRQFPFDGDAAFLFLSPERAAFDGYLEFVLKRERKRIGLIVIDEAHCVSQWGYTFRPAYAGIPRFLDRVFGKGEWPPILCLTATLNKNDRREILDAFRIEEKNIVESPALLRKNLNLSTEILPNEAAKKERLTQLLSAHQGKKVIVYVHRKKSEKYGTRGISDEFAEKGLRCSPFDGDMDADERWNIIDGFANGAFDVVFATSAFGMGIDIPDIRAVIHYLIPESIEQYYQEVGRAGRDMQAAYGYLLYTPTNAKVREDLIRLSVPKRDTIADTFSKKFCAADNPVRSLQPWGDLSEENSELVIWHYLEKYGMINVVAKGPGKLTYFEPYKAQPCSEYERYAGVSKVGLLLTIANKLKIPVSRITSDIYSAFHERRLKAIRVPEKLVFFESQKELNPAVLDAIESEMQQRLEARLAGFAALREFIEKGLSPEDVIREHLGVQQA